MSPIALTVAGSDPSGGAGIQADLKSFHQHGAYGASVLTLLTVQNTQGVSRLAALDPELVGEQLDAVLADLAIGAVKSGALGSSGIVEAVASRAQQLTCPLVVDPVMMSKHGDPLLDESAREAVVTRLLPCASLVTPNLHEAAALAGGDVETVEQAREAARAIAELGPEAVLVKGGHLQGDPVDVLLHQGEVRELRAERVDTDQTHGTGCTYSAAIAAQLAQDVPLLDAVQRAKRWLTEALRTAPGVGRGVGPVNHHAPVVG